jgi:hypothetical protein
MQKRFPHITLHYVYMYVLIYSCSSITIADCVFVQYLRILRLLYNCGFRSVTLECMHTHWNLCTSFASLSLSMITDDYDSGDEY